MCSGLESTVLISERWRIADAMGTANCGGLEEDAGKIVGD